MPQDRSRRFTLGITAGDITEVCRTRVTMVYFVVISFVGGPFIAYLAISQQIFQDIYDADDMFVIYFAMGSISAGAASLLNARLVMRQGMRRLSFIAMPTLTLISALLWFLTEFVSHPGFILFMVWQTSFIFCIGMIFGNVKLLAMEPLGHVAGLAAAIFGAISMLVSLPLS